MSEKLVNSFIASLTGCLSAVAMTWFLAASPDAEQVDVPVNTAVQATSVSDVPPPRPESSMPEKVSLHELEVDRLIVKDRLVLVDARTGTPLVELRDGKVIVSDSVLASRVAAGSFRGHRVQLTADSPSAPDAKIHGELAAGSEQGGYLALLSPTGRHSVNFGFDQVETGFIVSQNNQDRSVTAQVIMPIPQAGEANEKVAARDRSAMESSQSAAASGPKENGGP